MAPAPKLKYWLVSLGSEFIAVIFLCASIAKITNMESFLASVGVSLLVPERLVPTVAWIVVLLEMLLAIGIMLPPSRSMALQACGALSATFFGYSAWRALQGIPIPCHCFGKLLTMEPWQGIVLNSVLLAIIASLILVDPTRMVRLSALKRSAS